MNFLAKISMVVSLSIFSTVSFACKDTKCCSDAYDAKEKTAMKDQSMTGVEKMKLLKGEKDKLAKCLEDVKDPKKADRMKAMEECDKAYESCKATEEKCCDEEGKKINPKYRTGGGCYGSGDRNLNLDDTKKVQTAWDKCRATKCDSKKDECTDKAAAIK